MNISTPQSDFLTTSLNGSITNVATTATIGTGLNIPATNGVLEVDYDSILALGVSGGPETITYTAYNTSTGALTGVTRGAQNTTAVAHSNGANVQLGSSSAYLANLAPVQASTITFVDTALDDGSTVTNTTGSWTDITNMTQTVTTRGGNVIVSWCFPFDNTTGAGTTLFRILDAATTKAKFSCAPTAVSQRMIVSGTVLLTGLAAGSHTIKMQMQMLAGGGATARAFYGQGSYYVLEQSSVQ